MKLLRPALAVFGMTLVILSVLMLLPAALALRGNAPNYGVFLITAALTAGTGAVLANANRHSLQQLNAQKMFLITAVNWLGVSVFAAIPFMFSTLHLSITDAIFESVSGITTTGSTVLAGLDNMPDDILLWRSLCQWLGGVGIIAVAVMILPFLRIGGMRLFKSESSDWSGKTTPRLKVQLRYLVQVYLYLTLACALCYWFFGMNIFDAVNHAMTTVSTGGYSTHDASFAHFAASGIIWSAVIFMLLGGLPFNLYVQYMTGQRFNFLADAQVRAFLALLLLAGTLMGIYFYLTGDVELEYAFRHAFLNTTSIITTTGYASADYNRWGTAAVAVFFFLTFVGGCSGSTSGGIKIFRFQLFWLYLKHQFIQSLHPNAIVSLEYNKRKVSTDIIASSIAFMYMAMGSYAIFTIVLALCGLDLVTSRTGALTALMNVGPGLGDIIGPAGNFSSLPDLAKWALCIGMLLGRLEYLTLYILVTRLFWRG
jgi:trk system potassium uptake protein TrkH